MFVVTCLLSGCGTTHYLNSNPARNNQVSFNQDSSYCQAVAVGSAPMPNAPQYQNNVPMYTPGSGTMRDQYGNTYRYQENYNPFAAAQSHMAMAQQNWADAAAGLQQAAAQFQALSAREAIFNNCMSQHGWSQISKQQAQILQQQDILTRIKQAAEQGNANAQYGLGLAYKDGVGSLAQNDRKAMEWFRKAAAQGHAVAQGMIGDAYLLGVAGVAKNEKRAMEWFGKAVPGLRTMAEQGDDNAQLYLWYLLYNGFGVAKDEAQAIKWLKKSAAQGNKRAQDMLNQR